MYQSSEAFGNLVLQDSRTFKALITYDDVSITNAKSIKFTGGAEGEDDYSLGSTVSQYVTITIPDPGKETLDVEINLNTISGLPALTHSFNSSRITSLLSS